MNQVVAFDLDGTLSQSERFLLPAYKKALAELGLPVAPDEVLKNMIGGTLEDNIEIAMPGHTLEEFLVYADKVHGYAGVLVREFGEVYPGIPESLAALRGAGYKVALCSNGTPDYIEAVLAALHLDSAIDLVQKLEAGENKSQLLGKILKAYGTNRAVMVGDRHFDERAARDNGVPFIGCAYGIYPDEVQKADAVIYSAFDLPRAVEMLLA